ncbi:MAG: hypothetical protein JNM86_05915 [Phycisphaerae bacterium]|nr:hypothetical protein [Phycisphaerae bacterium]
MEQTQAGAAILDMLGQQHDLLAQVGELCHAQERVIEEDEPEQLVAVLEQRARILDRATSLGREIDLRITQIPAGDPQRTLIAQRRRAIGELARTIAETDRNHTASLAQRRDELARTLAGVNSGRAAAAAYSGARPPAEPGFQDRRV